MLGKIGKNLVWVIRKHWLAFSVGFAFAIVCFLVIGAVAEPFSAPAYCGSKCHEMADAYSSWELSAHYANDKGLVAECIDCHLPSKDKFFTHMTVKGFAGLKDTVKHHFGGEYDGRKMRRKVLEEMPNSRCLKCHAGLGTKPASAAAMLAHQNVLNRTEESKSRCVECHDRLHERQSKIFTSD
jgi:nitrate/TMAO reductase-like tetraheme cytochrome c subunit